MGEMKKKGAAPNKSFFRRIAESEFFHNYKRSPSAIVGTVIVVLVLFIALFGPLFAPQNPYDVASLLRIPTSRLHGRREVTPGLFSVPTVRDGIFSALLFTEAVSPSLSAL